MPTKTDEQDHYEILALTSPRPTTKHTSESDIKLAYRRALLLHHPDKSASTPIQTSKSNLCKPTIDQITIAYKTLIDPTARAEYDRLLALKSPSREISSHGSHPGLDTIDLDDLLYDEAEGTWYRGCRCGKERAHVITEAELEENTEYGELITGCQGCSLWLRVTFAVADDG